MAKRRVTRKEAAELRRQKKAQEAADKLRGWLGQQAGDQPPGPATPSPSTTPSPSATPSSSTVHAGSTIRASDPSILSVLGGKLQIPSEETRITETGAVMSYKQHAPGAEAEWMHVADFPPPQAASAADPTHHVIPNAGGDMTGFSEEEKQAVNEGLVSAPTGGRHPSPHVDVERLERLRAPRPNRHSTKSFPRPRRRRLNPLRRNDRRITRPLSRHKVASIPASRSIRRRFWVGAEKRKRRKRPRRGRKPREQPRRDRKRAALAVERQRRRGERPRRPSSRAMNPNQPAAGAMPDSIGSLAPTPAMRPGRLSAAR